VTSAMSSPAQTLEPRVDVSQCDTEPVHLPGAIQPHGVLFVLDPLDSSITAVSDNAQRIIGLAPEALLGRNITCIVAPAEQAEISHILGLKNLEERNPFSLTLASGASLEATAHRHAGRLIVECEPNDTSAGFQRSYLYNRARGSLVRLRGALDLRALCEQTAREVRALSGFDRVLVYAFKPDWSGEVFAEDSIDGAARYLGLRFPASDIPSQARALYTACRLRVVPTSTYVPAKILGVQGGLQIDLTHAGLRAVSPVHLEYMRNMGVTASMGISLMRGDELWGLITCNHESGERFIPYEARTVCALIGEVVSSLIGQKESVALAGERGDFLDTQGKIIQFVVQDSDVVRGLTQHTPSLLDVIGSAGAVLYYNDVIHCLGKTPPPAAIADLLTWLDEQKSATLVMPSLPEHYAPAHAWKGEGCGLLAASISFSDSSVVTARNWLLWFRPEAIRSVSWGGDPNKPASVRADERLHPRKSFEQWSEDVHLQSVPFKAAEVAAARSLADALTEVILEIEAGRQIRETALLLQQANGSLLRQIEENQRVGRVLAARTEQLRQRESSLQLVLDATGEGLLSVGLDGMLLAERSRAVEQWFGELPSQTFIWDLLFPGDPPRALEFELFWSQLVSDELPFETCADQMRREVTRDGRSFELTYREVREGPMLASVLVRIEDVTERAAVTRAARDAEEAQAILALVLRDAKGLGRALAELRALSKAACDAASPAEASRALHTLKGSAAVLGLMTLRNRCHEVEDRMAERRDELLLSRESAADLSSVAEEIARVLARVQEVAGDAPFERVDVSIAELASVTEALERGVAIPELLARMRRWTLEPVGRQLSTLAARARNLARDLDKNIEVTVNDGDLRVDADAFVPLWAALAHAISNAVDHGIEPEATRLERGKAPRGHIVISAEHAGDRWITIAIADDGAGVDLEAVRDAARRRGLPCVEQQELLDALFADALSTRTKVTLTSGRGVGLAALRETCSRLGGSVDLSTQQGIGTTLRVRIPVRPRGLEG
jgi:light-regulated signal transduction histidine kinase (bacteriophytochrome)